MKHLIICLSILFISIGSYGQTVEHISKLEVAKKKKKNFTSRDSSIILHIDTLILKDHAKLDFFGKKDVKLEIGHAIIGKNAIITGTDGKNNATNFDIKINIQQMGSLYVIARGWDAMNGTKTFPNGDGGTVNFAYSETGVHPQTMDKKGKNYLKIDVLEGGLRVNPTSDLQRIYGQIRMTIGGIRGLPQGRVYSGSPGKKGKSEITAYE